MAKILMIDNQDEMQNSLKTVQYLENCTVVTAFTGKDGIAAFETQRDIDCVICEIRMPDMTGTEITKTIKKIDPDMGIIVLTSHSDVEEAIRAMREGAYSYLYRPVYSEKLAATIRNAIKKLNLIKENRKLNDDLIKKNRYFEHINDAAQQILFNMTPKTCPTFDKLDTSAVYKSCDYVGGDMYDVFQLGQKVFFYVFDVCSHGILSAVMTMLMKSSFETMKLLYDYAGITPALDKVINNLNREMVRNTSSNIFVTLFAGVLDLNTYEMTYVSAGHIDQYLNNKNGIVPLSSTGTVIGIFDDIMFESKTVALEPCDRLFLFTDGIAEIWKEEVYVATDRMQEIILKSKCSTIQDTVHDIYQGIIKLYGDDKPDDDITILGLELKH